MFCPPIQVGFLRAMFFNHITCSLPITSYNEQHDVQRQKCKTDHVIGKGVTVSDRKRGSVKWKTLGDDNV